MEKLSNVSAYKLFILPGRCPAGFEHISFHNEVYAFWKQFWASVFKENNTPSAPDANIFYRQDFVGVVTKEEKIVGTVFFTENNLASDVVSEIGYFSRPYVNEFSQRMRRDKIHTLSTLEMLTVAPEFRKKVAGISFGTVLIGIVMEAFKASGAEIIFGPVRTDNGADKLLIDFGWKLISDVYSMHGTPVALSALFRDDLKASESSLHQKLVEDLWHNRMDLRKSDLRMLKAA
ncbi:MAG: hypothetical protein AB7K68_03915 [Bacteriovoracia bacterium]